VEEKNDIYFMKEALKEAHRALAADEVPVGAVIVHKGQIIARAHNQIEMLKDATAHAEMLALTSATNHIGNKWLLECSIYVTIEPCSMCAGALVLSRIPRLIYGADDPKTGACGSVVNIINNAQLNHRIAVKKGVLESDCASLMKEFFLKKRQKALPSN